MQRLAQGAQRREGRFSKLLYNAASIFPINSRIDGLVVDLFAGGGGASEGLALALGRDPDIAINHDTEVLEMHKANHPGTRHLLNDIKGHWMDNVMIELFLGGQSNGSTSIGGKWKQAANPIKYLETGLSSIMSNARIQLLTAVGQLKYTVKGIRPQRRHKANRARA